MAQLLKEEVRQRIIQSAKNEFLDKGYDFASLRKIAETAGMTVGNLYRYYDSKEKLLASIIAPAYTNISDLILRLSDGEIGLNRAVGSLNINKEKMHYILDEMADGLVDIHKEYPIELKIMMIDSNQREQLVCWFSDVIHSFIDSHFFVPGFKKEKALISRSFATAIFAGVKEMFEDDIADELMLRSLIKIYFRSYISLLDNDIRKYIGG